MCVSIFMYEDLATNTVRRLFSENQGRESFLPPPPLPLPSASGARGLSLSSLPTTGRTHHLPSPHAVPGSAPPRGGAPRERSSGLPLPQGIVHPCAGRSCFFFPNSCPLLPSCIFRETSYTIAGHPYLVTNLNVNALKDSPLV